MPENNNKITFLAQTNFRNQNVRFGIKPDDRRRHMYLIGKTGMGKTTVIENMIAQDIVNGHGVALVDPHGDIADKIIDFIPASRINDVIYFNPADLDYPIAFNVLEQVDAKHRHLIASGLVGVFKKIWADSWGPRLEYVLRNAILALLEYPGSSLLGIMRLLVDKAYRKKVVSKISDPVVKSFWVDEYSKYPDRFQAEAIAPIQNKVGQFLSTFLIRNIVGQVKSKIDMREVMDSRKILIMNLSKGRVGEDASALIGAIMITKIQLAAMSRVDIPEEERQDFYLYVDEFQNFATESFANILSEARKYRLNLIIAHQYIEQLSEEVAAAVFGNVGTMMVFRIGAADAETLISEFEPALTEVDLVNLAKYDTYMKLMIDGVSSDPFSASTLPPLIKDTSASNREKIIRICRERYAEPREVVEEKIIRWSQAIIETDVSNVPAPVIRPAREYKPARENPNNNYNSPPKTYSKPILSSVDPRIQKLDFDAVCSYCGQHFSLNFNPDPNRPVYCRGCLVKVRSGEINPLKKINSQNFPRPEPPALKKAENTLSLAEAIKRGNKTFPKKSLAPESCQSEQKSNYRLESPKNQPSKTPPVPNQTPANPAPPNPQSPAPTRDLKPGEIVKFE